MPDTLTVIAISCYCAVVSFAVPPLALLPVLLALLFPADMMNVSFIGMVACVTSSFLYRLFKPSKDGL